jgi:hypothetical protein
MDLPERLSDRSDGISNGEKQAELQSFDTETNQFFELVDLRRVSGLSPFQPLKVACEIAIARAIGRWNEFATEHLDRCRELGYDTNSVGIVETLRIDGVGTADPDIALVERPLFYR